jgi:hypothetical protein
MAAAFGMSLFHTASMALRAGGVLLEEPLQTGDVVCRNVSDCNCKQHNTTFDPEGRFNTELSLWIMPTFTQGCYAIIVNVP